MIGSRVADRFVLPMIWWKFNFPISAIPGLLHRTSPSFQNPIILQIPHYFSSPIRPPIIVVQGIVISYSANYPSVCLVHSRIPLNLFLSPPNNNITTRKWPVRVTNYTGKCVHKKKAPGANYGLIKCNWKYFRNVSLRTVCWVFRINIKCTINSLISYPRLLLLCFHLLLHYLHPVGSYKH